MKTIQTQKFYTGVTVYLAAKERIRKVFEDFEQVVVTFSGGKDSTVVFNLALEVSRELGKPFTTLFFDQEAEWQNVIDYVKVVSQIPEANFKWIQSPMRIENSLSMEDPWFNCWDESMKDVWMREKESNSIHSTGIPFDTEYKLMYAKLVKHLLPPTDKPIAILGGMRTEESPARSLVLTRNPAWKDATYSVFNKDHQVISFHTIYDWSYRDVWKYLHDNKILYCKLYDIMYIYGVSLRSMRVSCLVHQTSVTAFNYMQEVEPETWSKAVKRIKGLNAYKHVNGAYNCPAELPSAFGTWQEYRNFLLDKLVVEDENRLKFVNRFLLNESKLSLKPEIRESLCRVEIDTILKLDHEFTLIDNFFVGQSVKTNKYKG